jgi:hypothetical protein
MLSVYGGEISNDTAIYMEISHSCTFAVVLRFSVGLINCNAAAAAAVADRSLENALWPPRAHLSSCQRDVRRRII